MQVRSRLAHVALGAVLPAAQCRPGTYRIPALDFEFRIHVSIAERIHVKFELPTTLDSQILKPFGLFWAPVCELLYRVPYRVEVIGYGFRLVHIHGRAILPQSEELEVRVCTITRRERSM